MVVCTSIYILERAGFSAGFFGHLVPWDVLVQFIIPSDVAQFTPAEFVVGAADGCSRKEGEEDGWDEGSDFHFSSLSGRVCVDVS